jgi:hypothetical protein
LKRLGRYLLGKPRVVTKYNYQEAYKSVVIWSDSDWAGCKETRKSTSGGVLQLGGHTVKTWSTTQGTIALSSGEAELYALVKGASHGKGAKSLLWDFGLDTEEININVDATAAQGITNRRGLGKVRHIEVGQLWIQDEVAEKRIIVNKVKGTENYADALTKHVGREDINMHMRGVMSQYSVGRHPLMPHI